MVKTHLPIGLIALAFVVLALLYNASVPLGEGPDEPGHAAYVFFLAREGRLPVQGGVGQEGDVPGEGHQPPLAYALATPAVLWLPPEERQFDLPSNPRFTWAGGTELNAVAHGSREFPPWRGEVLAWRLARLASTLAGIATILLTYLAARALVDDRRPTTDDREPANSGRWSVVVGRWPENDPQSLALPLLAAALVAFNPQFLFASSLVTNDALLAALSAALLWLVVTTDDRRRAPGKGRALAIGAVLGLALLTKQSALLLAPLALLGLAVRRRERGREGERAARVGDRWPVDVGATLRRCALALGVAALLAGWWYLRNWRLYGDPLGLAAFRAEFATQPFDAFIPLAWWQALETLHASFWARFGWMNVIPPAWVTWLYGIVAASGIAGLAWGWAKDGRRPSTDDHRPSAQPAQSPAIGHWALVALPALTFAWLVSFALTAGLVAWQGRLLFPALAAIAILLAGGMQKAAGRMQNVQGLPVQFALSLLPLAFCLLALWLPFGVIRPAYLFHTLPEAKALERLGTPVYGRFGRPSDPGAELRGWTAGAARAGDPLDVTLMWHALGRQNRDWTVFIHVLDEERIVALSDAQPRGGAFPMTQWVAGDWVEDTHVVGLPADLPPGSYRLRVGLFDPESGGRRAGMYDQRGKLRGDSLDLGAVVVNR